MKIKYLSYPQAATIAQEHQHLVGQPFGDTLEDASRKISAVLPSPYSRILCWSFARQVVKGMPLADALRQWPLDRFDVIVISHNAANPVDFQVKDLRAYLSERGLEFKPVARRDSAATGQMPSRSLHASGG